MGLFSVLLLQAVAQDFPELGMEERVRSLAPVEGHPIRMVLDTDTYNEIDDQFALVYSLLSPELEVEAVYADFDKSPFGSKDPGELVVVAHKLDMDEEE